MDPASTGAQTLIDRLCRCCGKAAVAGDPQARAVAELVPKTRLHPRGRTNPGGLGLAG